MKILLSLLVMSSISAFAHGENKPGPNGGHIRMPGAFHTELVLNSQSAKVYLLDVSFKNPTTVNSQVTVLLQDKEVSCVKKQDHFACPIPAKLTHLAEIGVKAVRNGVVGKEATYPLPLSFEKTNSPTPTTDHSHHNH
ncbi:MAG: hypothetical protein NDI69_01300 [Bacteriovoracaceae bacterium]|nr:hypothetical protein [Bacteriovoracaceae bacterium]